MLDRQEDIVRRKCKQYNLKYETQEQYWNKCAQEITYNEYMLNGGLCDDCQENEELNN